jgi:hypothetical protein
VTEKGEGDFARPTSAIVCGAPGLLLDWIAYGFASTQSGGYLWTDIRLARQKVDERDPLALGLIAEDRLSVLEPQSLPRNDVPANAAISGLVRSDETPENLRRLVDFLRLPTHTQELLASRRESGATTLVVLSNAHRLASLYPIDSVGPIVSAIVNSGVSLFVAYPDEPPEGRREFGNVWHLRSRPGTPWREAEIHVEQSDGSTSFEQGDRVPLQRIPRLTGVLSRLA